MIFSSPVRFLPKLGREMSHGLFFDLFAPDIAGNIAGVTR